MRFVARGLNCILALLLALIAACGVGSETTDSARQPGGQPSTSVETPAAASRPPCSPGGVGDAARASDMRLDEECFISPLSLRRVDENSYELDLNCVITAVKDTTHTATVRRGSEGYGVRLTPDEDALVTDSITCDGGDGSHAVSAFVTVVH